jgi:small-conductance mechanosensitive channel
MDPTLNLQVPLETSPMNPVSPTASVLHISYKAWAHSILDNNSSQDWLAALAGFLVLLLIFWGLKRLLLGRLKALALRTTSSLNDALAEEAGHIGLGSFAALALYLSTRHLDFPPTLHKVLLWLVVAVLLFRLVRLGQTLLHWWLEQALSGQGKERQAQVATLKSFRWLLDALLWALALLFLLANLGVNITGLAAGLGIGGFAVALALQSLIKDLFASLSILMDKTFAVGDFIGLGDQQGVVERIGLRSTRLRSLNGELILIPNGDLTSGHLQNFKSLRERRQVLRVGVAYGTADAVLAAIPGQLKAIAAGQTLVRVERCHLVQLADSALVFELVYYVQSPDYIAYCDANQAINLAVVRSFRQQGIEIAYPTQTLFVQSTHPPEGSGHGEIATSR